jgi:TrmH family RNA methyltransferase
MSPYPPPSKGLLSRWRKLHTRKGREEAGRFLAEGPKLISEAFSAGLLCHAVVLSPEIEDVTILGDPPRDPSLVYRAGSKDLKGLAQTQSPQGILAEFDQPAPMAWEEAFLRPGCWVILDSVQDPGNVGAAIRVAAGLGAGGVLLTPGCAEVWNAKTLRSTSGAVFRIPVVGPVGLDEIQSTLKEETVWIAASGGTSILEIEGDFPPRAIVFGNESQGVSSSWEGLPDARKVGMPLHAGVESLNVGTAVAALLAAGKARGLFLP